MSRNEWIVAYFAGMAGILLIFIGEILKIASPDCYWATLIIALGGIIFLASFILALLRYTLSGKEE